MTGDRHPGAALEEQQERQEKDMAKFRVYANAVVSGWADVEAESGEEAIEKVWDEGLLPYAPGFSDYEFSEWQSPSEFDDLSKPEDDYRELDA